MTTRHQVRTILGCLAAVACSESTGPSGALLVHLERVSIAPPTTLNVAFTVTNRGWRTVYVHSCDGHPRAALEQRQGPEWTTISGGHCLAHVSWAPIAMEAGSRVSGGIAVSSIDPGTYRLVLRYGSRDGTRVVSAPFDVTGHW